MRVAGRIAAAVGLALLAASCATVPQPVPRAPAAGPGEKAPAQPAQAPGPLRLDREPSIDVGMAWDLDRVELGTPERFGVGAPQAVSGCASLAVARDSSGYSITCARPAGKEPVEPVRLAPGDTLWAEGGERGIGWKGKHWRGRLKIFVNPRGKLTLADRLPLETYLLGVVPTEIGGLAPAVLEAGRAQAVAARSYTLFYRGRRAAEGFDVYGTVEDQVYGPIESERPLATKCVQDTRGQVALFEGQPIRANYCSTCGGIGAEVWEAWPASPLGYLTSRRDRGGDGDYCAASPQYRWRERWSAEEFAADLARYAPEQEVPLPPGGAGRLVDVQVEARSVSGRVWRLGVTTTTGRVEIPAYAIRQILRRGGHPESILRSNLFKIGVRRDPATRRALEVVASGAGFGHGVGLCQTGAAGMARAGTRWPDILRHYYPGIELKRLY